jgi:transposase-like protein
MEKTPTDHGLTASDLCAIAAGELCPTCGIAADHEWNGGRGSEESYLCVSCHAQWDAEPYAARASDLAVKLPGVF